MESVFEDRFFSQTDTQRSVWSRHDLSDVTTLVQTYVKSPVKALKIG